MVSVPDVKHQVYLQGGGPREFSGAGQLVSFCAGTETSLRARLRLQKITLWTVCSRPCQSSGWKGYEHIAKINYHTLNCSQFLDMLEGGKLNNNNQH